MNEPSKEAFERFVKLQYSGVVNMVSKNVQDVLGITPEEHRYILNNYESLKKKYGI